MALSLALLFDEDTETRLANLCADDGHDGKRVVTTPALGSGADDAQVRTYADQNNRIIVTHDRGFLKADPTTHAGVFFAPNQRRSAFEHYRMVAAVAEAYPSRAALPAVIHLTDDWL